MPQQSRLELNHAGTVVAIRSNCYLCTFKSYAMASLKKNLFLNSINTVTSVLFPLITFPYAARVLMPDGIGAVNFQLSVINYIVLFTSLGIPMYAVKAVAECRDDKAQRDKITTEIIILSVLLCLVGYVAVWLLATFVPQINVQKNLFYILSLTIIFTAIGVTWFYQGIEDFKFVTIRAIIVRTITSASLFIFVKTKEDLLIYGLITVGATVGNYGINFIHLQKFIDLSLIKIKELQIMRHLKPAISVFMFNVITSLFAQINSVMLGFMTNDDQVGYYTAGTKVNLIAVTLLTTLGTVLLPRCSNLWKKGDEEGFARIINKSLKLLIGISLPMTVGLMLLAYSITMIFCGEDYNPSVNVLIWNAPVVFIIGMTNLLGIQILYTKNKMKIVLKSVTCGAIVNVAFILILVPHFQALGAAIAVMIAQVSVLTVQIVSGQKYFPFKKVDLLQPNYIIATLIMAVAVEAVVILSDNIWIQFIGGISIGIITYVTALFITKDSFFREIAGGFLKKFKRS